MHSLQVQDSQRIKVRDDRDEVTKVKGARGLGSALSL